MSDEPEGFGEILPSEQKRLPLYDTEEAKLLHKLEDAEIELKRKQKANAWTIVPIPFFMVVIAFSWIVALIGYLMGVDVVAAATLSTSLCVIFSFGCWVVAGTLGSSLAPESELAKRCRAARAEYHDYQMRRMDIQYRLDAGIFVSRREVQGKEFNPYTGYGW